MAQARVVHLDGERRQAAAARARRSGRGASGADAGAGTGGGTEAGIEAGIEAGTGAQDTPRPSTEAREATQASNGSRSGTAKGRARSEAKGGKRAPAGTGRADPDAAVSAGAARAAGERARRRRTTPLLAGLEQVDGQDAGGPAVPVAGTPNGAAPLDPTRPAGLPAPDGGAQAPGPDGDPYADPVGDRGPENPPAGRGGLAQVAEQAGALLAEILQAGGADGVPEEQLADLLAFLRRRLTGEYEVDEFGFDADLTDTVLLALMRPLYRNWFRVEVRGIENIPDTGGALVVANHSGAVAFDALMTQVAVHDEHPRQRHLRLLGADLVFNTPFLGELARKGGATLAANADAERLLAKGEVVGVWPEGFKGIGKPFSDRYKLQRFGRGGFVSAALRTRTPIVPCAIVGAEETYPVLGNMPTLARLLGLPYLPITPTFPLLGPLGLVPLPSKWLIEFGTPVATDELGIGAADDPMLVFDLTDQIRQTIQQTLYSLLVQRRSVFF